MSLSGTIVRLAPHYSEPADLLKAVRERHPEATKKEIMYAALRSMIEAAESKEGVAAQLHRMVMDNRSGEL